MSEICFQPPEKVFTRTAELNGSVGEALRHLTDAFRGRPRV